MWCLPLSCERTYLYAALVRLDVIGSECDGERPAAEVPRQAQHLLGLGPPVLPHDAGRQLQVLLTQPLHVDRHYACQFLALDGTQQLTNRRAKSVFGKKSLSSLLVCSRPAGI